MTVAALYVEAGGVYCGLPGVEPLIGSLYPKGRDGYLGRQDDVGHVLVPGLLNAPVLKEGQAGRSGMVRTTRGERESGARDVAEARRDLDTALGGARHRAALDLTGIDWVIVGGESGPGARPMHPDWAREVRDACFADDVAFFFKQWGEYAPVIGHVDGLTNLYSLTPSGAEPWTGNTHGASTFWNRQAVDGRGNPILRKLGKKHAGRLLDGRTWDEFPPAAAQPQISLLEHERDRAVAAIHERLAEPRKPVVPLTNGERRSNA